MNMETLQKWNPELPIYSVHDAKFAEYGRVITGLPTDELLAAAKKIEAPAEGSKYEASVPALEQTDFAKPMQDALFGELPAQVGYCWGHNTTMNAMEWHTSSEINVAVTPLVLILGRRADLVHNRIDSSAFCAFYLEAGDIVEVYATSLHFCPCEVSADGFGCIVGLPQGTNVPLDVPAADPLLFRKNKWLIAHDDNSALIARGAVAGISGPNYTIRYQD